TDTDWDVEERIFALEEAQKQAQERAAVALAASEKLKNSDIYSQLLDLRNEMSTGLAAIKQVSLSFTTLQNILKNRSEELEALKESVVASLNSSSALAENVAGLTNAVASAYSRVDGQIASVDGLNTQLEGHISELNELKESMHLYNVALHTDDQKTAAVKLEEAEQQGAEEEADEEAKEVEAMQEEQPREAEVDGKEDITPEEQEDEEITGQSEEQTVDGHIMDIMESLEEEISEEVGEIVEEESI
ncbi:Protein phosphatase 1 regulatory subunit 12A, partial [Nibea albiflora]